MELVLAIVSDVIETKTGNTLYRNLVFELRVDTFSVKCVPVETAKMYEKAIKSGKVCKAYTSLR